MIHRILCSTFLALLFCAASVTAQETPKVVGDWQGVLDAGAVKLRLVLHFKAENNALRGTMDSPDQGANGLKIDSVAFEIERKRDAALRKFAGNLICILVERSFIRCANHTHRKFER